jgi:hypothetical protein
MPDQSPAPSTKPIGQKWRRAATPPAGHLLDLLIQATRLVEVHPELLKDRCIESSMRRLAEAAREARRTD